MISPGDKFGKLEVLFENGRTKNRNKIWHCKCECGKEVDVPTASLTTGNTKSCGCLLKESAKINGFNRRKRNIYEDCGDYYKGYTTSGDYFLIDKDDYDLVKDYTWSKNPEGYIITIPFGVIIRMHMLIMNSDGTYDVDHINHLPHDNRKSNLRLCKHFQNITYSKDYANNTSGRKGVYWDKSRDLWMASITYNKKTYHLGRFENFEDAVKAREEAENNIHREYHYEEFNQ